MLRQEGGGGAGGGAGGGGGGLRWTGLEALPGLYEVCVHATL